MKQKTTDLVIARYKEDINWLTNISQIELIDQIYIYNKFYTESDFIEKHCRNISLPNIGREAHTYLYHIVQNYNQLNDVTVFLQGDPFPHSMGLEKQLRSIPTECMSATLPLNKVETENEHHRYRYHDSHPHGLYLAYFMDILFDINLDRLQTMNVAYGAQFCVPKDIILSRPLDFYKYLLKIVSRKTLSVEPYIFERLWLYIFDPKIKISDTYKIWTT